MSNPQSKANELTFGPLVVREAVQDAIKKYLEWHNKWGEANGDPPITLEDYKPFSRGYVGHLDHVYLADHTYTILIELSIGDEGGPVMLTVTAELSFPDRLKNPVVKYILQEFDTMIQPIFDATGGTSSKFVEGGVFLNLPEDKKE